MPSTTTLPTSGKTRSTRPVAGASSPVMICTVSSLRICIFAVLPGSAIRAKRSHHFGGKADDFQEAAIAQLTGDSAEDARPFRVIVFLVEDHQGVAVKTDVTAVVAARRLFDPHDHGLDHVARLDVAAGNRFFHA